MPPKRTICNFVVQRRGVGGEEGGSSGGGVGGEEEAEMRKKNRPTIFGRLFDAVAEPFYITFSMCTWREKGSLSEM